MSSRLLRLFLLVLTRCLAGGSAGVITSSVKMSDLVAVEGVLLRAAASCRREDDVLRKFAEARQQSRDFMAEKGSNPLAEPRSGHMHPNEAYILVKAYLDHWINSANDHPEMQSVLQTQKVELPSKSDLSDMMAAILRLQWVYALSAHSMYAGAYRDFLGPALSPLDAYAIGKHAFTSGMLALSEQWLRLSVEEMDKPANRCTSEQTVNAMTIEPEAAAFTGRQRAGALALLGRVHKYNGNDTAAREMYHKSEPLDPGHHDVTQLATELHTLRGAQKVRKSDESTKAMNHLCSRPKNQTLTVTRPYHVCRYKSSLFVPYLRYKEEILSLEPYVSVFHRFIHQSEIDAFQSLTRHQLQRAAVEVEGISCRRTSDLTVTREECYEVTAYTSLGYNEIKGWLHDVSHPTVSKVSARVKDATWLDVTERLPDGPSSAEPFQVVNYGPGGHYSAHLDPVFDASKYPPVQNSGVRIATFLMYLSDVQIGGHTAFVNAGISVAPVKGAALFWYNVDPTQDIDEQTLHAACPVLKGHKWIANKWIWTYGNTYRRPCGRSPEATQLDVERLAFSRRHSVHV